MKKITFFLAVLFMGVAFFASYITMERHSFVYSEKHKPIDFSESMSTVSYLGFSDACNEIYRIQIAPFVIYIDAGHDTSCENFIVSSIFELVDTMHERNPGRSGLYTPSVSTESINMMIDSINEALSHGVSRNELHTLIDTFHEHHWNTYTIVFSPFRSSADIISISNFDGTVIYLRDGEAN